MKFKKTLSVLLSLSMTMSLTTAPLFGVAADEDALYEYRKIISDFNAEYETTYQIATPTQLEAVGENIEDVTTYFINMTEDEFWNYLYDAYLLDVNSTLTNDDVTEVSVSDANNLPDNMDSITSSGIQKYYYSGSSTRYLYISATWNYGSGYNHYTSINQMGGYHDADSYPYYSPYSTSYYFQNSASEAVCTYECFKYIGYGITDATDWTVPFTAGGGDLWNPVEI